MTLCGVRVRIRDVFGGLIVAAVLWGAAVVGCALPETYKPEATQ